MACIIIITHFPGKATYAADFLSRMRTDTSGSSSLKLRDKTPLREMYSDTAAKLTDALTR